MAEYNEYLSKDGKVFKTVIDIGLVDTKQYDLETLLLAEKRLNRGTNKTFQAALNSVASLRQHKKQKDEIKDARDSEFDEYGLSPAFYSEQQISFIRRSVDKYHNGYDIATPYQEQGVIQLAKYEWTMTELGARIAQNPNKEDIGNLKIVQELHAKLSNDLKLTTRQATGDANSEDMWANACVDYEARYRNAYFEFEEVEERDQLQEIIIANADKIFEYMSNSTTYYHFRKQIADNMDMKAAHLENIGLFTIEEFFDFLKINEDRRMIGERIEATIDESFVDAKGDDE